MTHVANGNEIFENVCVCVFESRYEKVRGGKDYFEKLKSLITLVT